MALAEHYPLSTPIVVAGAGGFIGGHLVCALEAQGFSQIRAVDCKPVAQWFQRGRRAVMVEADLRRRKDCLAATEGAAIVFNFAADMGGMGYIEQNKLNCMLSVLINTHMLEAAAASHVERFFFASSACVYRADLQAVSDAKPLREEDAYPAMPEDGYGWEKLFSERMCRHFGVETALTTRVARFHNVYGPHGSYAGGREKAPAAICRKVAQAKLTGVHEIEIWGDGEQTRSFLHIDDAVEGLQTLMTSEVAEPTNLGSDRLISINALVDVVEEFAGIRCRRSFVPTAPLGVRGRNSDNTFMKASLGWSPSVSLEAGLARTYRWIYDQVSQELRATKAE